MTGHARYSLSELTLLREPVAAANPLTLLAIPLDGMDQAPVTVRALDCDTIGQLKAKLLDTLYRNTPHSQRIGVDQFDLGEKRRRKQHGREKGWKRKRRERKERGK